MERFTILIAEDEKKILKAETILLRELGCSVLPVADASLVYNTFLTNKVDLCILDLMMPGLDSASTVNDDEAGFILSKMIKKKAPDMPILILTGKMGDKSLSKRAMAEYGVTEYVLKPISERDFFEVVMRTLKTFYPKKYAVASMSIPEYIAEPSVDGTIHLYPSEAGSCSGGGTCEVNGIPVILTDLEFGVLSTLYYHPGHLMTAQEIYENATGKASPRDVATQITIAVNSLRLKFNDENIIVAGQMGLGYKYNI